MNNIFIHQIFYDNASKNSLAPEFIPLDNTNGPADWFEFYPIMEYLKKTKLQENAWYGFLSPKFHQKTGIPASDVIHIVSHYATDANVVILSPAWDQLAYFRNPFEQGEFAHPGLLKTSQDFLNHISLNIDLTKLVTYSATAVFSNFIVAKPEYWTQWLQIAQKFYGYTLENRLGETSYLDAQNKIGPMKTFIQERLASIILSQGIFKTLAIDFSQYAPIHDQLFDNDLPTRKMLQTCDLLKEKFITTHDQSYLDMYFKIRKEMNFKQPHPTELYFL